MVPALVAVDDSGTAHHVSITIQSLVARIQTMALMEIIILLLHKMMDLVPATMDTGWIPLVDHMSATYSVA